VLLAAFCLRALPMLPLDFGTLDKYGAFVGSHAIVIFSEQDDIAEIAINLLSFFKDESCGQCTPCRVGCDKAVALLKQREWDKELLAELAQTMRDASICGLGQAAPNAFISAMQFFLDERLGTEVAGRALMDRNVIDFIEQKPWKGRKLRHD
jgi:formate dehydrogenase